MGEFDLWSERPLLVRIPSVPERLGMTVVNFTPSRLRMAALCGLCSLMGQGRGLPVVDAFGCLCSLRARSALDGVSWVQGGSVEIAVGQRLAPATESAPSTAPSLGRRSSWELDSASCRGACRA